MRQLQLGTLRGLRLFFGSQCFVDSDGFRDLFLARVGPGEVKLIFNALPMLREFLGKLEIGCHRVI